MRGIRHPQLPQQLQQQQRQALQVAGPAVPYNHRKSRVPSPQRRAAHTAVSIAGPFVPMQRPDRARRCDTAVAPLSNFADEHRPPETATAHYRRVVPSSLENDAVWDENRRVGVKIANLCENTEMYIAFGYISLN